MGLPVLALAFALDAKMSFPGIRPAYYASVSLVLFAIMYFYFDLHYNYQPGFNIYNGTAALGIIVLTVFLAVRAGKKRVAGDNSTELLDLHRIRLAQSFVAFFIIAEIFIQGSTALAKLYPVCYPYLGTAAYILYKEARS